MVKSLGRYTAERAAPSIHSNILTKIHMNVHTGKSKGILLLVYVIRTYDGGEEQWHAFFSWHKMQVNVQLQNLYILPLRRVFYVTTEDVAWRTPGSV